MRALLIILVLVAALGVHLFRYQPLPRTAETNFPAMPVWDRLLGRACLALGPPEFDPAVVCTMRELEAVTGSRGPEPLPVPPPPPAPVRSAPAS